MREVEFRPSTLEEREAFYRKEFDINKVKRWFKKNGMKLPQICALDAGTDTGIIKNPKLKGEMIYFLFSELKGKIKEYVPEDVYYDRGRYKHAWQKLRHLNKKSWTEQEIVFDVDSDNISKCDKLNGRCLSTAYSYAKNMKNALKKYFKEMKMVYSGRGFHIHILDKKAYMMNKHERKEFTAKFRRFPIDLWVSQGNIELIRLPYSLNSLVSRKVTPINKKFRAKEAIPDFLKKNYLLFLFLA
ncbi:hypothetical protein J4217_03980 [Candidatus Pacearchaeota archaeon]|nr:hypothetical protein [uncultured archaeon]AQS33200.1 hypothetical protein [uncultured archaeon]MBS3091578.1 hypothetical protein [Candidatus Pacearchaeota archaeon]